MPEHMKSGGDEKYKSIFENSIDAVLLTTPDGRILAANPAACRIFGKTEDEIISGGREGIVDTSDPKVRAAIEERTRTGKFVGELTFLKKDGTKFSGEISSAVFRDSDGTLKTSMVVRDATPRKKAEDELRQREALLRETLDGMLEGCQIIGFDWRYLYVNDSVARHGRKPKEELLGKTMMEAYPGIEKTEIFSVITKCMKERKSARMENKFEYPDGFHGWFDLRVQPVPEGAFILSIDITERKKVEEALKKSQTFLNDIIDQSPFAIWISDEKGTLVRLNKKCKEVMRISDEEVVGKYNILKDNIVEEQGFMPLVRGVFERGEVASFTLNYESTRLAPVKVREPVSVILEVTIFPIKTPDGQISGVVVQHIDITERKKAEKALEESEGRYRLLAENISDFVWAVGLDMKFIYCSPSVKQLLGYAPEEYLSKSLDETLTHESYKSATEVIAEEMEMEKKEPKDLSRSRMLELEAVRKDGSTVWIGVNARFMRDSNGRAIGIIGVSRDIAERKKMEESLRASESKMSNAAKMAHLGPWEYDVVNDRFTFTDAFYAIFRTTAKMVGGYTMPSAEYVKRFVHPDDAEVVGKETRKAIETRDPNFSRQLEHRMIYSDGEIGYISVRFFVVKDENGETMRTYGVNQDITERKRAEQRIRETNEYLDNLIKYANAPIIVWDANFSITRFNHAFERVAGRTAQDVLGKQLEILFPDETKEQSLEYIRRTVSGERWETVEIPIRHVNGTVRTLLWNSANIYAPDGKTLISTIAQGQDITERKKAEETRAELEAVKRTNELKTRFVSVATHELRTPVVSIKGYTDILVSGRIGEMPPKQKEMLEVVSRNTDRLLHLVEDLLDVQRIDSGRLKMELAQMDVREILGQCERELKPLMDERRHRFTVQMPDHQILINGDFARLNQVLSNMLTNSQKFTPDGGTIEVELKENPDSISISVKDNGIGIRKEDIGRVFDLFADIKKPAGIKGTGLGLNVAKGIVAAHNGSIEAFSEGEGKGATFTMTLPKSEKA